jgi:hypothetical protein
MPENHNKRKHQDHKTVNGVSKLHAQQKLILRWLWHETQKCEAYLVTHNIRDKAFQRDIARLERIVRGEYSGHLDLNKPLALPAWHDVFRYHRTLFYWSMKGGILWVPKQVLGHSPNPSERASLSRSLKRLIDRGFVKRIESDRQFVALTAIGSRVSEKLILPKFIDVEEVSSQPES